MTAAFNQMLAQGPTPIKFADPINQMAQLMQLKNAQQTGVVNQMAIDKGQRQQADQAAYRNMLAQPGFNSTDPATRAQMLGLGRGEDLTALDASAKTQRDLAKTAYDDRAASYKAGAPFNGSVQDYLNYFDVGAQDPVLGTHWESNEGGIAPMRARLVQVLSTPEGLAHVREAAGGKSQKDVAELAKIDAMKNYYDARAAAAGRPDAADAVKPPSGYAFNSDGSLRFIPGGPEDPANQPPAAPPSGYVPNPNKPGELLFVPGGPGDPAVIEAGRVARTPLKSLPSSVAKAIQTNKQNLRVVDQALTLLSGEDVGELQGDKEALGAKTLLPALLQSRLDPKGVSTRAAIGDLESMIIHERSGAAVPASEQPRLKPFLPIKGEKAEETIKKLKRFRQIYNEIQSDYEEMYSEATGYNYKPGGAGATPPFAKTKPTSDDRKSEVTIDYDAQGNPIP